MDDVTVSREDQQNINKFSRLNLELTNLEALLKEKRTELEYLCDSIADVEMYIEEDTLSFKIGDSFVAVPIEEASQLLADMKSKMDDEIAKLDASMRHMTAELGLLKVQLYGKFKNSINLERD